MADIEYFGGLPQVGIVPRAPHSGPLLRHVYEQEHGRGGFSGKVSHTYPLYPPTNWLPGETATVEDFASGWESPLRPLGGVHHALRAVSPGAGADAYRGMARLVALGLGMPEYMAAWSAHTRDPRFAYDPARLDDVRAVAERLADARGILRPPGA